MTIKESRNEIYKFLNDNGLCVKDEIREDLRRLLMQFANLVVAERDAEIQRLERKLQTKQNIPAPKKVDPYKPYFNTSFLNAYKDK